MDDNKSGSSWNTAIAVLVAVVLWLWWEGSEKEAEDGGTILDDLGPVGDIGREVMDAVSPSSYPARWGGGIRKLAPYAAPFFAKLFEAMERLGYQPRSNYPHQDKGQGCHALDIVDNTWARNAWQTPTDETIRFYRDLGAQAQALGLVWGGVWADGRWKGSTSAWAKAWRQAANMGDMLHVEWYPSTGTDVPA